MVVLEFNELTPMLMDKFIDQGELPNFKRLRKDSRCYITSAGEDPPFLEPWIQWVTVHTGLTYAEHGVFNLGDSPQAAGESVWDIASRAGQSVWICGSMNANYRPGILGWILPDPWSVHVRPNVQDLLPYFEFVRSQVLEYTRTNQRLSATATFSFVLFMLRHGLRFSTVVAIASQLVRERFSNVRWRRAAILDLLQFDLFRHVYKRKQPSLATFFINSTAHLQHIYWRNMDPSPFIIKPTAADQKDYGHAVLSGYKSMDRIVGETLKLVGDDAVVIFATALSQQPCLKYEGRNGKRFYKPDNFTKLLGALGIDPNECSAEPVMSEQFHLRFRSSEAANSAAHLVGHAAVNDRPALSFRVEGSNIFAGCSVFDELPPDALLVTSLGKFRFSDMFYFVDTLKSGMHHSDGMLWIRSTGSASTDSARVPLTAIAPTILKLLDLPVPARLSGSPLL